MSSWPLKGRFIFNWNLGTINSTLGRGHRHWNIRTVIQITSRKTVDIVNTIRMKNRNDMEPIKEQAVGWAVSQFETDFNQTKCDPVNWYYAYIPLFNNLSAFILKYQTRQCLWNTLKFSAPLPCYPYAQVSTKFSYWILSLYTTAPFKMFERSF